MRILLFLLIIFLDSPTCHSFNWFPFSSSSSSEEETDSRSHENADNSFFRSNSEFSMEAFGSQKAVQRVEDAKNKLSSQNSCWHNAAKYIVSGCKDMVVTEDKRKRFAYHLTDCFFRDSGRLNFPTLQRLAEFSQKQQEELAKRQEQLQQVHDHLFENSKSMLAAQEAFEAKQANMFVALDKLFALHNAMLLESRVIKAFFIYFLSIFVIYMFTSTKQTYTIRPRLYIGLCITLALEVVSLRYIKDAEHQAWMINVIRSLFTVLASAQLLHAAFTYRDYEVLNHQILLRLVDKVNEMEKTRDLSWHEDTDSEVDWTSWIDMDLTDDEDNLGDPDYKIPEDNPGFTSSMTRRLYSFRPR